MKLVLATALLAVLSTVPAFADCTYPRAPDKIPDGNSAALEEMVAVKKAVEQYNKDMEAYLSCIKLEHDDTLAKQGEAMTPEKKKQFEDMQTQKNNAAVTELQSVADRFNEQVRNYKAKHPSKK
ncbi:MAG: hypothetical protein ABIT36_01345 [Steroidobacteraceae bacterium]